MSEFVSYSDSYLKMLQQLHQLNLDGKGESQDAVRLIDRMNGPWEMLDVDERRLITSLTVSHKKMEALSRQLAELTAQRDELLAMLEESIDLQELTELASEAERGGTKREIKQWTGRRDELVQRIKDVVLKHKG